MFPTPFLIPSLALHLGTPVCRGTTSLTPDVLRIVVTAGGSVVGVSLSRRTRGAERGGARPMIARHDLGLSVTGTTRRPASGNTSRGPPTLVSP